MFNSDANESRHGLRVVFDAIEKVADRDESAVLLMCLTALRQVHDLYPDADELRYRGTPEYTARTDIHNTIVAVMNGYLSAVRLGPEDDDEPYEGADVQPPTSGR